MAKKIEKQKPFFSSQGVIDNYSLLQDIGFFSHIDSLELEITNYKNLFKGALDIVNRTTIGEIMDATVRQISDRFLPSFITFLWKPLQNREDVTVRSYKHYQLVDLHLRVDNIDVFESFFKKKTEPVTFKKFSAEFSQNNTVISLDTVEPELIIPILGPSGLYGLVLLGRNALGAGYNATELLYIQNLMSFFSKAIQSNLHYERTLRDVKTGLYNYGFFMTRLNEEIVKAKRANTETSVVIIDVDHFKNFNDKFGHLAGDRFLESLAITLKQGVRLGDVPSRFGGEEFTVLLPNTGGDEAWQVAERLRTMVEELKVNWEPPLPRVTISLGIFTFDKKTNLSVDGVISRMDDALYLSKHQGRNRTTLWHADLQDEIQRIKSNETFKQIN
jgi:diguanylate cyclase (GGDEF)-like protein